MNAISRVISRTTFASLALVGLAVLAGCERPPVDTVQRGYRGTGMEQVYNPRTLAELIPANQPPPSTPPAPAKGPKAKDIYKNVQVLGDLSSPSSTATWRRSRMGVAGRRAAPTATTARTSPTTASTPRSWRAA